MGAQMLGNQLAKGTKTNDADRSVKGFGKRLRHDILIGHTARGIRQYQPLAMQRLNNMICPPLFQQRIIQTGNGCSGNHVARIATQPGPVNCRRDWFRSRFGLV
jgi:hypothetical protein